MAKAVLTFALYQYDALQRRETVTQDIVKVGKDPKSHLRVDDELASRMHAVEQGADLRGITVLAFGGAGPVHACGVAELLESPRVVFPVNASVLSAFGTLISPVRIDLARSMVRPLDGIDPAERDALLQELREEGRRVLATQRQTWKAFVQAMNLITGADHA